MNRLKAAFLALADPRRIEESNELRKRLKSLKHEGQFMLLLRNGYNKGATCKYIELTHEERDRIRRILRSYL